MDSSSSATTWVLTCLCWPASLRLIAVLPPHALVGYLTVQPPCPRLCHLTTWHAIKACHVVDSADVGISGPRMREPRCAVMTPDKNLP